MSDFDKKASEIRQQQVDKAFQGLNQQIEKGKQIADKAKKSVDDSRKQSS